MASQKSKHVASLTKASLSVSHSTRLWKRYSRLLSSLSAGVPPEEVARPLQQETPVLVRVCSIWTLRHSTALEGRFGWCPRRQLRSVHQGTVMGSAAHENERWCFTERLFRSLEIGSGEKKVDCLGAKIAKNMATTTFKALLSNNAFHENRSNILMKSTKKMKKEKTSQTAGDKNCEKLQ